MALQCSPSNQQTTQDLIQVLVQVLENAGFSGDATAAGPVAGFDPVLISLIRRAMPNLVAYDLAGVQPMSGPTGLIFAMRSRYSAQNGCRDLLR